MKRPQPIPQPESKLPSYESLPETVRRLVREELGPVLDGIEEIRAMLAGPAGQERPTVKGT
jgi:hypothetical protein